MRNLINQRLKNQEYRINNELGPEDNSQSRKNTVDLVRTLKTSRDLLPYLYSATGGVYVSCDGVFGHTLEDVAGYCDNLEAVRRDGRFVFSDGSGIQIQYEGQDAVVYDKDAPMVFSGYVFEKMFFFDDCMIDPPYPLKHCISYGPGGAKEDWAGFELSPSHKLYHYDGKAKLILEDRDFGRGVDFDWIVEGVSNGCE